MDSGGKRASASRCARSTELSRSPIFPVLLQIRHEIAEGHDRLVRWRAAARGASANPRAPPRPPMRRRKRGCDLSAGARLRPNGAAPHRGKRGTGSIPFRPVVAGSSRLERVALTLAVGRGRIPSAARNPDQGFSASIIVRAPRTRPRLRSVPTFSRWGEVKNAQVNAGLRINN